MPLCMRSWQIRLQLCPLGYRGVGMPVLILGLSGVQSIQLFWVALSIALQVQVPGLAQDQTLCPNLCSIWIAQ